MALYRCLTRNSMGFRHKCFSLLLLSILLSMLSSSLLVRLFGGSLYQRYRGTEAEHMGEVGFAPTEEIPRVSSLKEMKELETFVLVLDQEGLAQVRKASSSAERYKFRGHTSVCAEVILTGGEGVIVRMPPTAAKGRAGDPPILPVGRLRPWSELPDWVRERVQPVSASHSVTEYYIDMVGEGGEPRDEEDYRVWLTRRGAWIGVFLWFSLTRVVFVRWGWAAALIRHRGDGMMPHNDLELWCASVYGLWSSWRWPLEGWPLMGGMHRTPLRILWTKAWLRNRWQIHNSREGLKTVQELVHDHAQDVRRGEDAAWDLCRAMRITGSLFLCRMIDRPTMDQVYALIAQTIRRLYSSWDELMEDYMTAYAQWAHIFHIHEEADLDIRLCKQILRGIRKRRYGPYSIPWDLRFSSDPRTWTRTEQLRLTCQMYQVRRTGRGRGGKRLQTHL